MVKQVLIDIIKLKLGHQNLKQHATHQCLDQNRLCYLPIHNLTSKMLPYFLYRYDEPPVRTRYHKGMMVPKLVRCLQHTISLLST